MHFSILMTLCSAMGMRTPPVGNLLYLGVSIADSKVEHVLKYLWSMVGAMIFVVILDIFLPRILGVLE